MSREVRHDGTGALEVRFPYDRDLVERIKTLPRRRWNAAERFWSVPESVVVELVDLLRAERFRFDDATQELYRSHGGASELEAAPAAAAPTLPLFDESPTDYSVSRLNEQVRLVIEAAFPQPVWVVGEISGFNRNTHKRHVSFQLAERDDGGNTLSSVDATLFDTTRRTWQRALDAAGQPFRLEDEVTVRVRARVELYVPWGSYRVIMDELDVGFTLGEAARRREEIIRRLTEEGLVGLNSALPMPALPLRVGLISSLGSDAYNDVVRTLQESGYAFELTTHGARVQGRATEPSVLNALDWFRERAADFDVVLVCRGGGSRTDLAWFDSYALGCALARFPLPVIVGIGHEADHSVLDVVGRRRKTPTAAAAFVVDTVRESLERLEETALRVLALAAMRIDRESRRDVERGRRLALSTRRMLQHHREMLGHRRERVLVGTRVALRGAAERLARWTRDLGPRSIRTLQHEGERVETRDRRLHLLHPHRVLERGYAVLRLSGGAVLTRIAGAPPGTAVEAELRDGRLRLQSEGPATDQGGS